MASPFTRHDFDTLAGTHLGFSEWLDIDQARVDLFAQATGDHQWIHVDQERAAGGPFGGTIAHGYLTLSLLPWFLRQLLVVDGVKFAVNYGCNKVRFISPVRVGSRLRGGVTVASVEQIGDAHQVVLVVTIEIAGQEKPACVAEAVTRYTFG